MSQATRPGHGERRLLAGRERVWSEAHRTGYHDTWAAHAEQLGATGDSTVSVRVVRGLIEAVEQTGVASAQLLRAAQLAPAQLDAPDARIPRSRVYRLCEAAIELTGDPALGLHWAEKLGEGSFVPVCMSPVYAIWSCVPQRATS